MKGSGQASERYFIARTPDLGPIHRIQMSWGTAWDAERGMVDILAN